MRNLLVFTIAALMSFAAVPTTEAQGLDTDFEVQVGAGYANPEGGDNENFIGSAYVSGISFDRFGGGALYEVLFTSGDFNQRVFARGEATIVGPTFAALDAPINGTWDPRAVFGINYEHWVFEGYSQIDGELAYGFVVRWRLF